MTSLALTLPLSEAETATSFASRLAACNGSRYVQDFIQDMSLHWNAIIAGDPATLEELAIIGGAERVALERYSVMPGDERNRRLGPEVVHYKLLRQIRQHVCLFCIGDPDDLAAGPPVTWQLQPVRVCLIHAVPLVELEPAAFPRSPYDLAGRVYDDRAMIRTAQRSAERVTPGGFDRYVSKRVLGGVQGSSWLDTCDLATAWRASETLGIVILHGSTKRQIRLSPMSLAAAANAGFDAISGSMDSFVATLRSISEHATGERGGFHRDFSPFARWLERMAEGPGSHHLLEAVRDFVEETYPVGVGDDILGRPCRRRRMHSMLSAAQSYGMNWSRMRRLVHCISASPNRLELPAPTRHFRIDAEAWDPFLRRYARALNPKLAAAVLGVRQQFFMRVAQTGWVKPVASFPGLIDQYDEQDLQKLQKLLDRLLRRCVVLNELEPDMTPILQAHTKCHYDTIGIIELVRDDQLAFVGRLQDIHGLQSIVVRPREIREVLARPRIEGYLHADLKRILGMNSSTISLLIKDGTIEWRKRHAPRTQRLVGYVTHDAFQAFRHEYITLSEIAKESETLPKHAVARLARKGIHPISLPSRCSKVYRRVTLISSDL